MIKKIVFAISAVLLSANLCFSAPANIKENAASPTRKNFLWQVRSATATVYILGSMHFAKEDLYPLDKKIEESFSAARFLMLEANIGNINTPAVQKIMTEKALYPAGDSVEKHLSGQTLSLLQKELQAMGYDLSLVSMFRPWLLALQLTTLKLQTIGFDPNYGIDVHFLSRARQDKRILELESIEFQLNLFAGLTDREQDLFLYATLLDFEVVEQDLSSLVQAWKNGDALTMEGLLKKGVNRHPELLPVYKKILYGRNANMAANVEKLLTGRETGFVIVGAGHLVGKEGIVELLRKKGYAVEQL